MRSEAEFVKLLESVQVHLQDVALTKGFSTASEVELAVYDILVNTLHVDPQDVVYATGSQNFPDIVIWREYGIEVKFKQRSSRGDKWREIANSIFEGSRLDDVKVIYVIFCKMSGIPEVRVKEYGRAIYHVRTSHVPRFAISMEEDVPLFGTSTGIPVTYTEFRALSEPEKMELIRGYARKRHPDDWLWWIDGKSEEASTSELVILNYTKLPKTTKRKLSSEALVVVPRCLTGGRGGQNQHKTESYARVGSYWLRAHGVYSSNVRDALTAGSMVDPCDDGNRMRCLVRHNMPYILEALRTLSDEVLREYWSETPRKSDRLKYWLSLADKAAESWLPSREIDWPTFDLND